MLLNQIRKLGQVFASLRACRLAPGASESSASGLDCRVDIVFACGEDCGDCFSVSEGPVSSVVYLVSVGVRWNCFGLTLD